MLKYACIFIPYLSYLETKDTCNVEKLTKNSYFNYQYFYKGKPLQNNNRNQGL